MPRWHYDHWAWPCRSPTSSSLKLHHKHVAGRCHAWPLLPHRRSVFELVEGCGGKPMPLAEWSRLSGAMLGALRAFHDLGMVHRDVKV